MLPQQLPQQQVPSKSLQTMEIKKDYKSGNFFAKKGTQLKGEVIVFPSILPPSPTFFKVFIENAAKGGADILIPYEYFEETKTNTSAPDSAKANPTNPIIIYAAVAVGSILIYKYFIK